MPKTLSQKGLIIGSDYNLLYSEEVIHVFSYLAGINSQDNDFVIMLFSYVMDHFNELIPSLVLDLCPLDPKNPVLVLFNKIENTYESSFLEQILSKLPHILNGERHFIAALLLLLLYAKSRVYSIEPLKLLLKNESERLSDAVDMGKV